MSNLTNSLQLGASAMHAHSRAMAVIAHNVANVNTVGYGPQRAVFTTGPDGQGVRFTTASQSNMDKVSPRMGVANAVYDVTSGLPPEALKPSGTNLSAEMARMISTQHAYEANAQVVHAGDIMLGRLLDIRA